MDWKTKIKQRPVWGFALAGMTIAVTTIILMHHGGPKAYRVTEVIASGWQIPALDESVSLRSASDWTLRDTGGVLITVGSGQVKAAQGYLARTCHAQAGTPAKVAWIAHSGHQRGVIAVGVCTLHLTRLPDKQAAGMAAVRAATA